MIQKKQEFPALRAPTRSKNHFSRWKFLNKALMLFSFFLGMLAVLASALISTDLALLGFMILCAYAFCIYDKKRERDIKAGIAQEIFTLKSRQDMLEDILQGNDGTASSDMQKIKKDIATLRTDVNMILSKIQAGAAHGSLAPNSLSSSGKSTSSRKHQSRVTLNVSRSESAATTAAESHEHLHPIANDISVFDPQSMSDLVVRELLHKAVHNKKIDVFIQPVMRLPGKDHIMGYELYARIRAKKSLYVPASRFMELAHQDDLMGEIDNLLLLFCMEVLESPNLAHKNFLFFLNLKPETLKDQVFMNTLLAFFKKHSALASALMFEIKQSDFDKLSATEKKLLTALNRVGCSFSIDHVTKFPTNLDKLQEVRIRYVKIKAEIMLDAAKTGREFADLLRKKRKLEANGIGVIVEHVESEEDLAILEEYQIHYAQGYLFGQPEIAHTIESLAG